MGYCQYENEDYYKDKEIERDSIMESWKSLDKEIQEFEETFGWDDENTTQEIKCELSQKLNAPYNHFYYSDMGYNRCGDKYGKCSGLITHLSYHEFAIKMKEYALAKEDKFCRHAFLESLSNLGFHYECEDYLDTKSKTNEYNVESIDVLSEQEKEMIKKKKEEADRLAKEQALAEQLEKEKQHRLATFQKLKAEFEPNS